jgi:cytochrome c553
MKRLLKWLAMGLGVLVLVLAVAVGSVYALSGRKLNRTFELEVHAPASIPEDAESIAEGGRLVRTWGCAECHAADLGGRVFIDAPPMGTIAAPNLTPGGVAGDFDAEDWARAVRHGIGGDGRGLVIMPSAEYSGMSDQDLSRVIAYLRSIPAVSRELPERSLGPVARTLLVTGAPLFQPDLIDHERTDFTAPPRGATAEYGAYLATVCAGCHGESFEGGNTTEPGTPPSANLTPHAEDGLGAWTNADFRRALREGRRPDGTELSPSMPWTSTRHMEDDEIEALWLYLSSLPALESEWRD